MLYYSCTGCLKKKVIQLWYATLVFVYERNFCIVIKSKVLAVE